jgi:hypothetical protein
VGLTSGINSSKCQAVKQQYFAEVVKIAGHPNADFEKHVIEYLNGEGDGSLEDDLAAWARVLESVDNGVARRSIKECMDTAQRRLRCYNLFEKEKL